MKFILFIIILNSNNHAPIAIDHIAFNTQAACEQLKTKLETRPQAASGGFLGAVNAINNSTSPSVIEMKCESVDDAVKE